MVAIFAGSQRLTKASRIVSAPDAAHDRKRANIAPQTSFILTPLPGDI
jgi:hypothetical protein